MVFPISIAINSFDLNRYPLYGLIASFINRIRVSLIIHSSVIAEVSKQYAL